VFEPLNDLDEEGNGIQVPASYYMHISNTKSNNPRVLKSQQREIQRKIDQPLLYFYAKDFEMNSTTNSSLNQVNFTLAQSPFS